MQLKAIDHIGIAVRSVDAVKETYRKAFGLEPAFEETVEDQKVRIVAFAIGNTRLEYMEPTAEDSPISKFLEKRGEGLHHIAIAVDNVAGALEHLKSAGFPLIDEIPRIGAEGKQIAFLHPSAFHKVLIELTSGE